MEERKIKSIEQKQRQNARIQTFIVILMLIVVFFIGLLIGTRTFVPTQNNAQPQTANFSKLDAIYDLMLNEWYFGKDIDTLSSDLLNQAMVGMTNFEVDPNTGYMTSEESAAFTQSIDLGFVGIGVSYYEVDGKFVIERVFRSSPAEKAGVQAGDIISKVDGMSVEGVSSDDVVALVKGEIGSEVVIEFIRQNKPIEMTIIRDEIENTTYSYITEDNIGVLEISQFGSTTGNEAENHLNYMLDNNVEDLIIDLRDNGGGYLTSLLDVAGFLLPDDTVVLKQEARDGSMEINKVTSGKYMPEFKEVVVLVNENSASASEVLTAALSEQRGATIVGTTTFGKGTVQIPKMFSDGSSLKYTVAQWLTPNDEKIHEVGIAPDKEVFLHDIFYAYIPTLEEGTVIEFDTVAEEVRVAQLALDLLGYGVDRTDGYFDKSTVSAIKDFQEDMDIAETGDIDSETMTLLTTEVVRAWSINREEYDVQFDAAVDLLK